MKIVKLGRRYVATMKNPNGPGGFIGFGTTRVYAMRDCLRSQLFTKVHATCTCDQPCPMTAQNAPGDAREAETVHKSFSPLASPLQPFLALPSGL